MKTIDLQIKQGNNNYTAFITQINKIRKHSNADRLQCVDIAGFNVITDLSTQKGDYYVYFPIECIINKEFLSFINAFEDSNLNNDKTKCGFFNKHGRVRAIRLRGERSEGFIISSKILADWLNIDVEEFNNYQNYNFDTINNKTICQKYIPVNKKSNVNFGSNKNKFKILKDDEKRLIETQFKLHDDTDNLRRNIDKIHFSDYIKISYKMHGTNATIGKVLCNKKLTWFQKILKTIGLYKQKKEYALMWGSRRVVKNKFFETSKKNNSAHYYDEDIWGSTAKKIEDKLEEGITLYGEIVGYTSNGNMIQPDYDYGCVKPNLDKSGYRIISAKIDGKDCFSNSLFYVFRITYTTSTGKVYEFLPEQIESYCIKHSLCCVKTFFKGYVQDFLMHHPEISDFYDSEESAGEMLVKVISELFLEKKCHMCKNDVPAEGVVVEVRPSLVGFQLFDVPIQRFKLKSFAFLERESKNLDNNAIGLEESEEVQITSCPMKQIL